MDSFVCKNCIRLDSFVCKNVSACVWMQASGKTERVREKESERGSERGRERNGGSKRAGGGGGERGREGGEDEGRDWLQTQAHPSGPRVPRTAFLIKPTQQKPVRSSIRYRRTAIYLLDLSV